MDFDLTIPVRVISGKGCVEKNSGEFSALGTKCLVVTGKSGAKKSGALDDVIAALEKEKVEYVIFDEVGPNPLLSVCWRAGEVYRQSGAQFIVGIGGGSALDAAKAIAIFASNKSMSPTDIYAAGSRNRAVQFILIGTTSGTGSEVGRVAVLTNDETGRKKSIAPNDCYAALAFADSSYTESMPFSVTVSTALDALSHAIEGYFSVKCSDIPTMFAERAVELIWPGLKQLEKTHELPNESMRRQLYYGSLYAGITLAYCGTAFPHPLGYILTENYGVAHGMACAEFMPEFLNRAEQFEKEKFKKLLLLTGETKESFCAVIKSLTKTGEIKMTAKEIEKFCSRWETNIPNNFKFSPGGFSRVDAQKIFSDKWEV